MFADDFVGLTTNVIDLLGFGYRLLYLILGVLPVLSVDVLPC